MGRLSGFKYRRDCKKSRDLQVLNFSEKRRGVMKFGLTPNKNKYTTIPKHRGDMPEGTLRNIIKQAGLTVDDFIGLL